MWDAIVTAAIQVAQVTRLSAEHGINEDIEHDGCHLMKVFQTC